MFYYTPYIILPLFSAAAATALAIAVYRQRNNPAARQVFRIMIVLALWAFSYALNTAATTLSVKMFFYMTATTGASFLGVLTLALALELMGYGAVLTRGRWALLAAIPLVVVALAWTAEYNTLFRNDHYLYQSGPLLLLGYKTGPLYLPYVAFQNLMLAASIVLFLIAIRRGPAGHRLRYGVLIAGIAATDAVFLLDPTPLKGFQITTSILWLTAGCYALAIYRHRLFEVSPLARSALFDYLSDPVLVYDREGNLADCNRAARMLLGDSGSSLAELKSAAMSLFPSLPMNPSEAVSALDDTVPDNVENGRSWRMKTLPVVSEDGVIGCLVQLHDITSLMQGEQMRLQAREWEDTFNAISDMVLILDQDYRILKANRAAAEFLGNGQISLVGQHCHPLHHEGGYQPELCPCRETFGDGKAATREFYEPKFKRYLEVSTSPLFDHAGKVSAAVHITKDVTWRKKMEEEFIRTEKLGSLAVLAGGIAHDFNNMLTIIMSTTTLAKMYAKDDPRVVAKIEEAEQEIIRTRELTNQLLTFAKGGAPVKRLSSFTDLLRDTVEFSLKGSNVVQDLIIAPDLWAAEIDRTQISQVISNLVINAVQAMPDGGTVRVRAANVVSDGAAGVPAEPGRYVSISVEDTGSGIAPEKLQNIFVPFFTTKAGGSGLGLATSYSIVRKHNGHIDVKSRVGAGSVFTVFLPASREVHVEDLKPAGGELEGGGRVLLMDDDEKLLRTVGEMLGTLGYEVETARNGEEAIILYKRALALSRPFGAVILDVTVAGGMGGRDCIRRLLDLDPGVKAIVVSGYSEDAVLAEYGTHGFKDVLTKPFTAGELRERLGRVMAGRGGVDA